MDKPLLQVSDLSCERGYRLLFSQLNFSVAAGQLIQIAGANGSGKSSLLKIIAGLSSDYRGSVLYQGQAIADIKEQYCQQLCYLAHNKAVKQGLTVLENLAWFSALYPCDNHQMESVLKDLALYRFRYHLCSQLSAGQQQRVALARLLISRARLWILDEPFTAIDKQGVMQFEQLLAQQAQQGRAIILTTHHKLSLLEPAQVIVLGEA